MRRTRVYIAGPMTNGGGANYNLPSIREAILAQAQLVKLGYAPMCPQLTIFAELISPTDYEHWLGIDLAWVEACDCILRIPGPSKGADREVAHAEERGIPVYTSIDALTHAIHPEYRSPRYHPGELG